MFKEKLLVLMALEQTLSLLGYKSINHMEEGFLKDEVERLYGTSSVELGQMGDDMHELFRRILEKEMGK
jgi:hypothetical protein